MVQIQTAVQLCADLCNFTLFYFVFVALLHFYCSTVSNFYCYFIQVYVFTVISMICDIS